VLVTAAAVEAMRPGSVVVDMAASALGGNCELSRAGETVVTENGVTILAPENLAASLPISASQFYARNMAELVLHLTRDGALHLDMDDEITAAVVITRDGSVIQPATAALLPVIAGPGPGGPPASVPSPGVAAPASRGTRSRRASGSRRDEGTGA
jgi:NAD(P) transhydrogenase subunit alpha